MSHRFIESNRCFEGVQSVYTHWSNATKSEMRFGLFLPPAANTTNVPVLYWLSGLTCSEQNFITKAGAQRVASELGLAIVIPDTSPRGVDLPSNSDKALGEGASFYVDATEEPWANHYQMYSYLSQELPTFISDNFPIDAKRCGIFGHSMGGHGALMIGLRNPQLFQSISAFSPICSPTQAPWGINAFQHYLGDNKSLWDTYDACYLMKNNPWPHGEILIDQGGDDPFMKTQLKPELFTQACLEAKVPLKLRFQHGYNHSYYFISTFMEEHLRLHAKIISS